jgi:hypothetical protein
MEIKGTLLEFPLPEFLQFLDRRGATGCLSLDIFSDHYAELLPNHYDIRFNQGQLVALQRKRCKYDIYDFVVRNEWISLFAARKVKERSPNDTLARTYLESQGVLNFGQLRSLFFSEVVHRLEALCDVQNAAFVFQSITDLPVSEMTGLSISKNKLANQGMKSKSHSLSKSFGVKELEIHRLSSGNIVVIEDINHGTIRRIHWIRSQSWRESWC